MEAIKPDTPVNVKLLDENVCLRANTLAIIKSLATKVKDLKVEKDPVDGVSRATLDLKLTQKQFIAVLSKAHGGRTDPRFFSLFSQYNLSTDRDYEDYLRLFSGTMDPKPSIRPKSSSSEGAIAALVGVGSMDMCFEGAARNMEKKDTFVLPPGVPQGRYSVSVQTILPTTEDAESMVFIVPRNGDMCHTLVLKVLIPPKPEGGSWSLDVLDQLFKTATMSVGGSNFDRVTLQANNAMAVARGIWPIKCNTPPRDDGSPWLVTIPLMFSETEYYKQCFLPMLALAYHEVRVHLGGINPKIKGLKMVLEADFVYVDKPLRRAMANDYEKPVAAADPVVVDWKADKWDAAQTQAVPAAAAVVVDEKPQKATRSSCKNEVITMEHFAQSEFLSEDGHEVHIRLPFNNPTSGLMITLSTEDEIPARTSEQVCPIMAASFAINNYVLADADFVDLTEFNWLKVGLTTPRNNRTLLLPFSREMFSEDVCLPNCSVNLSRIDNVMLNLVPNKNVSWMKWTVTITSFAYSARATRSGMMGQTI